MIRSALLLLLLSSVLLSCDNAEIPTVDRAPFDHEIYRLKFEDPGQLHNEVVRAYANRCSLAEPAPLLRTDFVAAMVAASNEVLASRGLSPAVQPDEVEMLLATLLYLRKNGVYDVFQRNGSDLLHAIDRWERDGFIPAADAPWLKQVLIAGRIAADPHSVPVLGVSVPESESARLFEDVYQASAELWYGTDSVFKEGAGPSLSNRDQDGIFMDALGGLIGNFIGGGYGGIIGAAAFSIMYYQEPPGGGGWDCSDYCNMG
jgi:hypothetical protein